MRELRDALKKLDERMAQLGAEVLSTPPADYAGFCQYLGRYAECKRLRNQIHEILQGKEEES